LEPIVAEPEAPAITKIWNKMFVSIFFINSAMMLGQFMMNTLIPKYADYLGANSSTVGIVTSVFVVTAFAIKPVSGPMIDTYPKKWLLFGSILLIAGSFVIYTLAYDLATVVVARLIHGLGMGFTATICLSLATEALPKDKLAQGIGYYSLGQAMISAVGPSSGLALAEAYGYNTTFAISAVIMSFSAFLVLLMKAPKEHWQKKLRITLSGIFAMEAIIPATLQLFFGMSYSTINSFLVLYAENGRGVENIGHWFTVNAIGMLISRPIVGRLSDKYGVHKVMPPAMGMFAISFYVISVSTNIYWFLFSALISAWGYGVIMPANQTLCMKCVTPDRRGVGGNTNYIGMDIGAFFGPIIAGSLVAQVGYGAMFQFMILPVFAAAAVFVLCYPKIKAICLKRD
jgi:MFS family permease